ncbi:MAG: guanylate kinase [Lewinellaceae bacterium]|nr:guanylate kinase [Phaeodactylibacter sp.]MCB9347408.1 guanylate kinase [Lewinellaceae bacterium]
MSKLLLFAAPSGAGKTTIVHHLLNQFGELEFSISATTRPQRPHEEDGKDYYFISRERFQELIRQGAFVEWEEVYEGLFYGTLKSEVERLWAEGKHIIFDIDVKGAMNIKKEYPREALAVFVKPPSMEALEKRLKARRTEDEHTLKKRLARASEEMAYENKFDRVLVNDVLKEALATAEQIVESFIKQS